jgi:hypothetical protein
VERTLVINYYFSGMTAEDDGAWKESGVASKESDEASKESEVASKKKCYNAGAKTGLSCGDGSIS